MKKTLAILLVLLMVAGFSACGGSKNYLGTYKCVRYEYGGMAVDPDENDAITLEADGKGIFASYGTEIDILWKIDGETFTIENNTGYEETYSGTLKDGVITIDIEGVTAIFAKDGAQVPDMSQSGDDVDDTEGTVIPDEILSYWNRDWYGWWAVYDCTGSYEEWEGYWWDTGARFEINYSGHGTVNIWDEDLPDHNDGVASVEVQLDTSSASQYGDLRSLDGWFMDSFISENDLTIYPEQSLYENMVTIEGTYTTSDGSYSYLFVLRPWGTVWDDVEADSPDDLPYYYYDWYLPLIEDGKPMPDTTIGQ